MNNEDFEYVKRIAERYNKSRYCSTHDKRFLDNVIAQGWASAKQTVCVSRIYSRILAYESGQRGRQRSNPDYGSGANFESLDYGFGVYSD